MIGNEGYLARRLDQIDQDYARELTASAQLHSMLKTYIDTHGGDKDGETVGTEHTPITAEWDLDMDILPDHQEKRPYNRYGDTLEQHIGLYFYPVLGNHLYSGEGTTPLLNLVACRNGVVDADTGAFLDADEIRSLHDDLAEAFAAPGAEPPIPTQ